MRHSPGKDEKRPIVLLRQGSMDRQHRQWIILCIFACFCTEISSFTSGLTCWGWAIRKAHCDMNLATFGNSHRSCGSSFSVSNTNAGWLGSSRRGHRSLFLCPVEHLGFARLRGAVVAETALQLKRSDSDFEPMSLELDSTSRDKQLLSAIEMDDPEDEDTFSINLFDASSLMEEETIKVGARIYDSRIKQSYDEWVDQWKQNVPQRTIYEEGLPRDRWVPLSIPITLSGIVEQMRRAEVQKYLQDPQQRNYWIYASGRTIFFFLSSVLTALLQINVDYDPRPWVYGRNVRKEISAALKRIAMSGEVKGESNTETSIPRIERVFRLFGSLAELYRRDCENIAHGIYRYPYDANLRHRQFNPFFVRSKFLNTFKEAVVTGQRRARTGNREIVRDLKLRQVQALGDVVLVNDPLSDSPDLLNDRLLISNLDKFPDYYLQNFHWQTDGWLSSRSARSYEYTTESLFSGSQDAMQRQGLVSVSEFVALNKGIKEEEELSLLEVACGTGRQHTFIKDNWPRMRTTATDLSPFYLQVAEENMNYFADFTRSVTGREVAPTEFVQANAEDLPFADASFDVLVCTYLFHELPFPARKRVAKEMFRVVAPGGIAVVTDSFQKGDVPDRNHIAKRFPANYWEPYYMSYFENTDLVKIFQDEGFTMRRHQCAHLSKVLTFEKLDPTMPRIEPYKMWAIV